jgi:hypothetical protein
LGKGVSEGVIECVTEGSGQIKVTSGGNAGASHTRVNVGSTVGKGNTVVQRFPTSVPKLLGWEVEKFEL